MKTFRELINESDNFLKEKKRWESNISSLLLKKMFIGGTKVNMIDRVENITKIKFTTVGFIKDYGFDFEKKVRNVIDGMKETDSMLNIFSAIDYEIESNINGKKLDVTLIITYDKYIKKER